MSIDRFDLISLHPYISGSGFIPSTLKKQIEEAGSNLISPFSDRLRK